MHISAVLVRFYKSFNYNYLRKVNPKAAADPWEKIGDAWYPFVRVDLEPSVTTVVGANESGKSHLLTAIEKALSGDDITRQDFCRYSPFFTVEKGQMRWPDFGLEFRGFTPDERRAVAAALKRPETGLDRFVMIRTDRTDLSIWVPQGDSHEKLNLSKEALDGILKLLPRAFRIDAQVGLPDSVPIAALVSGDRPTVDRAHRADAIDWLTGHSESLRTPDGIKSAAPQLAEAAARFLSAPARDAVERSEQTRRREIELARELLFKIAKIDETALADLAEALKQGKEGLANGLIQEINRRLADVLNFPTWWVQDKDFQLLVSAREQELAFTVRDRTKTEYSFRERSAGLKYFLSYYVQYRAHVPSPDAPEILVMDEPDAFLSSQGQQDLLKIFSALAAPSSPARPVQVAYVTHSPWLIDKNHAERVRVLEKGTSDEGTRVVRDASRNHYEPLRSAFGSFVGETAFIGNCNLVVEGVSDQVLLAGCVTLLRDSTEARRTLLDLNQVTIVPAGSASQIPYVVYLARGRDLEKPSVVVLADGDDEGKLAKRDVLRDPVRQKTMMREDHVVLISDIASRIRGRRPPVTMEDLVPPTVACAALRLYLKEFAGWSADEIGTLKDEDIVGRVESAGGIFKAIEAHLGERASVSKVGFARAVLQVTHSPDTAKTHGLEVDTRDAFLAGMRALIEVLAEKARLVERERRVERDADRVRRSVATFMRDHATSARREDVAILLEEIESAVGGGPESDWYRLRMVELRREFELGTDLGSAVADFARLSSALEALPYAPQLAQRPPVASAGSPNAAAPAVAPLAASSPP